MTTSTHRRAAPTSTSRSTCGDPRCGPLKPRPGSPSPASLAAKENGTVTEEPDIGAQRRQARHRRLRTHAPRRGRHDPKGFGAWAASSPPTCWSTLATVPTRACWSGCCPGSTPSDPQLPSAQLQDQPHSNALAAAHTIQVTYYLLAAWSAPARPTNPCGT